MLNVRTNTRAINWSVKRSNTMLYLRSNARSNDWTIKGTNRWSKHRTHSITTRTHSQTDQSWYGWTIYRTDERTNHRPIEGAHTVLHMRTNKGSYTMLDVWPNEVAFHWTN
jgi:hypothetical protein